VISIETTLRYLQNCADSAGIAILQPDESRRILDHIAQLELAATTNRDVIVNSRQAQTLIDADPDDDGTTYYTGAHPT